MKRVVLDTSALFTLIENEEGCEYIEQLIEGALKDEYQLYLSVIAKIELYYISVQEQSVEVAKKRMELIDDLPINIIEVKENLIETIGNYKANYSISFADSCIAGQAKSLNAELVHKDPEYEQLEDNIAIKSLPYKT